MPSGPTHDVVLCDRARVSSGRFEAEPIGEPGGTERAGSPPCLGRPVAKPTAEVPSLTYAYIDGAGRYADFHSLRHTTGSLLAASGVHPKIAQSLMRHSDINLTMPRYTHTLTGQEAKAIESLPDLSLPDIQTQGAKATGTYDGTAEAMLGIGRELTPKLTPELTPAAFPGSDRSAAIGTTSGKSSAEPANRNSMQDGELGKDRHRLATVGTGREVMGRTGVEPATHGFSVRCSTS